MNEESIYEALGVTRTGEGAQGRESAAPAAQEPAELSGEGHGVPAGTRSGVSSDGEQEFAAPASDGNKTGPAGDEVHEVPAGTRSGVSSDEAKPDAGERGNRKAESSTQAEDEARRARSDAAARRRRAETQAAIDRAVSDALTREREARKAEMDVLFQAAGLKNTITGTPITNMDEFNAWKQAFDTAKFQKDLKAGELTPEGLERAISNSPVMQRMKEIIERDAAARRESDAAAAKAKIDAELQEIHKLDPSINTTEDLLNMPAAKEFYEYVRKGNTFLDAFYLANRQRLTEAAAESARQQAMNAARSKEHLHPAGTSRGAGAAAVPAEEMELFKLLNPKATEAEIQTYYNRSRSQ